MKTKLTALLLGVLAVLIGLLALGATGKVDSSSHAYSTLPTCADQFRGHVRLVFGANAGGASSNYDLFQVCMATTGASLGWRTLTLNSNAQAN